MQIIDAHHHLWNLDANYYPWLSDESDSPRAVATAPLRRNYLLEDFRADAKDLSVVKSVHVQAEFDESNPVGESAWLQGVADAAGSGGFPHGIVAYADLSDSAVEAVLEGHLAYPNVRGIRQILNWRADSPLSMAEHDYLSHDVFKRQFGLLRKLDLSFDLQLLYDQMGAAAALIRRHPDTTIILDHTGMPIERDAASLAGWRRGMQQLAECPNVSVKLSGLGMSAQGFDIDAIRPLVLDTIGWFGVERCLFASNFPVDGLGVDYHTLWKTFDALTADFSEAERRALFHDNAERVYRL